MIALLSLVLTLGVDQTMNWHKLPNIPDPEGFAAPFAGVSHGQLLVAGGANFPDKRPWEGGTKVWYQDIYALDQPNGDWKRVGQIPRPLAYGVSASYQGRIYCVGGGDADQHYSSGFVMELVDGNVTIRSLPPLPIPIANGCGALVGSTLYVAGGQTDPSATFATNDVFALDLNHPVEWHEIADLPGPGRILATASAYDGALWVVGGASLHEVDGKAVRTYLTNGYCYRPSTGWQAIVDLPYPVVAAPSPAPFDKSGFYILGGDDGSLVGTDPVKHPGFPTKILRYNDILDRWELSGHLPFGRVTVPTVKWHDHWVMPNGERKPGIRSPEVWAVRLDG